MIKLNIPGRTFTEASNTNKRKEKLDKYKIEMEYAKQEKEAREKVLNRIKSEKSLKSITESRLTSKYE